jgi:chromosome segregation ATPase
MIDNNALLRSVGAAPDPTREGLPFWIFWLLLCIILLLLFFIFLRDKDLRRRMSAFLSAARRRVLRKRLAARVRRETHKKAGVWRELGRKAWSEDVRIEGTEETFRSLAAIDKEINGRETEWQGTVDRIQALESAHEEAQKLRNAALGAEEGALLPLGERLRTLLGRGKEMRNRSLGPEEGPAASGPPTEEEAERVVTEIASAKAEIGRLKEKVHDLRRANDEADRVEEREIREWIRKRDDIQDRITQAKKASIPLTESLGRAADEARVDHAELTPFYAQIDGIKKAIRDFQARIEKLS